MSAPSKFNSSSSSGSSKSTFIHPLQSYDPSLLFAARIATLTLQRVHPPIGWESGNKGLVWKMIQERKLDQATEEKLQNKMLRFARYNTSAMIKPEQKHPLKKDMQFNIVRKVYAYEPPGEGECHWWVNFADAHLFGFYGSLLFAQDEWQCQEHPVLCSLKEFLEVAPSTFPHAEGLTVARAPDGKSRMVTPCLVMNAPRDVDIDAVGYDIYGNSFSRASKEKVKLATKVLSPPTLSNIIAIEALKYGRGFYKSGEILLSLQTALSGFRAAKIEALQDHKVSEGYEKQDLKVIVHSGNWGCGAFGGNVELMCIIQILAARLSSIDRLVYHVLLEKDETACQNAIKQAEAILKKIEEEGKLEEGVRLERIATLASELNFRWGLSNGT